MKKKYNIIEVIEHIALFPQARFNREGDKNFMIKKGNEGDLCVYIKGENKGALKIFNYMYDIWILEDKEEKA